MLAPFFTGSPWDPRAFQRKADEVAGRFDAERRQRMASAIRATSPTAATKLAQIASGDGVFVTTGQQAGLATGPLYTIYKILSAVQLARALEPVLDRPVAPLFWIASDDHDWQEVNHLDLLTVDNSLERLTLSGDADTPPLSMRRQPVGPGIEVVIDRLRQLLPDTEFSSDLLEQVRDSYRPERSMAEAFGDLVDALFADFDLLRVDAGDPTVKRLAAGVWARELEHSAEHEALLEEQTSRLVAAGYHAQVSVIPGATNVFYEDERGRERLLRDGPSWMLRRTGRRLGVDELNTLLTTHPERFSPNVLLRPVVESTLFPTVSYVAGPGELSYYAQVGCLFREYGIDMPVIFPRFGITLVESKVRKVLDRFGLRPEALKPPVHEVAARVLRKEVPEEARAALGELRRSIQDGYARLVAETREIDPTLKGPLERARNSSQIELNEVDKKIVQHLKQRNTVAMAQLDKAHRNLFPGGDPQERVLNVMQYLARYGPELLPAIGQALRVELDLPAPAWAGVECG